MDSTFGDSSTGKDCVAFISRFKYLLFTSTVKMLSKDNLFQETRAFNERRTVSSYPIKSGTKCAFKTPFDEQCRGKSGQNNAMSTEGLAQDVLLDRLASWLESTT